MTYAVVALLIVVVFVLITAARPDIDGARARALVSEGAHLIDVRTVAEFDGGHVDEAKNVPLSEVAKWGAAIEDKTTPVVLYCQSGLRSGKAAKELRRQGFSTVYNLGSMRRWSGDTRQ